MRDQKRPKDKSTNKKNPWDNTHPLCPHPHPDTKQPPPTYPIPHRYSIFIVLGDSEGIPLANRTKIPQQYAALVSIVYVSRGLGLFNTPGGGIVTSLFMVKRLLADNGISPLMPLRDSTVRGLELMIASISAASVFSPSSLRLWPWFFSKAARILLALPIWCSHTPLICEAPGGFLYLVIQPVPFCRR